MLLQVLPELVSVIEETLVPLGTRRWSSCRGYSGRRRRWSDFRLDDIAGGVGAAVGAPGSIVGGSLFVSGAGAPNIYAYL
jgi:hypothetical protein